MGLFTKEAKVPKRNVSEAVEKAKLSARLEKGKLKKEISDLTRKISSLENKKEQFEHTIKNLEESRDYYKKLENDREALDAEKRVVKIERQDLAEDRKEYQHQLDRLNNRAKRLEAEENDEYKKGYSDGLADGLRKAHDITREDRKYMTMIAMSTNQSQAIETSMKALKDGYESDTKS